MSVAKYTSKDVERFWSKVDCSGGDDACWRCTAGPVTRAYKQIWWEGSMKRAHRIAWMLTNGTIPDGMDILHECDNPPCCNPSHLFLGTPRDNAKDKARKGRASRLQGERHPLHKLTSVEVSAIREQYILGKNGYSALAKKFGVSRDQIRNIVLRKQWRHL